VGSRWLAALAVLLLIGAGVQDLGARVDEVTLGVTECFEDEERCLGVPLDVSYLRVAEVLPSSVRLRGQGFEMEVVDWQGPVLPSSLAWVRVSVRGPYLGAQRMGNTEVVIHRYRRVKEWMGVAVLLLWGLAVLRFVRGRLDG
jgi:hypothetical protein